MTPFDAGLAALVIFNLWIAFRYARTPLAQDEALWLLWGWTGARPYRDFVDCKPPGIHVWFFALSRLCGRRIVAVKFAHHVAIGAIGVAATIASNDLRVGIAFTALGQSAWLHAYHAELEALSAALLLIAFLAAPWPAVLVLVLVISVNLKLALPAFVYLLARGWWPEALALVAVGVVTAGALCLVATQLARDLWYCLEIVPRRMLEARVTAFLPCFDLTFVAPLLLVAPAVAAAVVARPEPALWLPAIAYLCVNASGRVWRPYHWLPFAAFVAVTAPPIAPFLLVAECTASGLYLGDFVERTRPGVRRFMDGARKLGEKLRELPGSLYVLDEFTQVYIHAVKRPALPFVEQVEIRAVIPERRHDEASRLRQVELVAAGPGSFVVGLGAYHQVARNDGFVALQRTPERPGPM